MDGILGRISKDKELFEQTLKRFEEGKEKDIQLAYCLFVGSYYHDKSYGEKAIDAIQRLANHHHFQLFNSMMIQAHFYLQKAPGSRKKLNLHLNQVNGYVDPRWRALNPFIVPSFSGEENEVIVGIRMTNFDKKGTHYFAAHGGKIKNYYEGQRFSLKEGREKEVYRFRNITKYPRYTNDWYGVEGLEDYRVAAFQKDGKMKYRGIVVSIDAHDEGFPEKQLPRQSLVDINFLDGSMVISNLRPLKGKHVNNLEAQKNWLPFFDEEGQLFVIYKSDPVIVMKINEDTGTCEKVFSNENKEVGGTAYFRGSSPPVVYQGNYLYSVHLVGFIPEGRGRVYYHRLVEMSKDFQIQRISRMFYLNQGNTVEYISGAYNDGERIHLTYGFDDKEAWMASLTHQEIEEMF